MPGTDPNERWRRQVEIFHRALEKEPRERSAFVEGACNDDPELRREVEALLAGHDRGSPLDASIGAAAEALREETRTMVGREFEGSLGPGSVVAGRFEITGVLGRGGMGTVYEARDRRLGTSVALKLLRDEIAGSEKARARFLREINLARTVTHPNVCRVFDLLEEEERTFLTMELLEGETLAQRLERVGRLPLDEAQSIVDQVASALEAAHAVGVVHRDLKPSNVMLVQGSGGVRAVVTDFGLATTQGPPSSLDPNLTRSGQILGTPAYMAPEQLEGGIVTSATDVYAFGLMIFEMVTGTTPFQGDSPFSVASRRLQGEAPSPRLHVPHLERRWERTILRCLERHSADRFQTPGEVAQALAGDASIVVPSHHRRNLRHRGLGLAAVLLVAVLGLLLWQGLRGGTASSDPPVAVADDSSPLPFEEREIVLVTVFENRTGEPAWDGGLGAVLARELSSSTFVTVAPRPRIVDTLRLMRRPPDTVIDAELGREIALRDGGIRAVVSGEAEKFGATYVLSARIVDPEGGVEVAILSEEAESAEELYAAVRRLSSGIRQRLGESLGSIRRHEERLVQVSTPSLPALRLYSEAEALVGGMTGLESVVVELLEQALAEDPDFASAHLLQALTFRNLGRREDSSRHMERAMELSETAPERERYYIRSRYFESQGDGERAKANREALLRLYPDHFWANQIEGLNRSLGKDPREAIPFQIRKARSRPTNLDANWDAGQLLAMLTDRDEEARFFLDRVVRLGEEGDAIRNEYELTWARLWAAHEHWLEGDVQGCREELDRWAAALAEMAGRKAAELRSGLLWGYRGLGMATRAAGSDLALAGGGFLLGVQAFAQGDSEGVLRHLAGARRYRYWGAAALRDPRRVSMLARSGFVDEATEVLTSFAALEWAPTPAMVPGNPEVLLDLMRGEVALAEGRTREAVEALENRLGQYWVRAGSHVRGVIYFESSVSLAAGLRALDEPEKAVAALERASRQRKQTHPYARESWLRVQLELTRLYRELDREAEARTIEAELRDLMRLADPDFWLVEELERIGS